MKFNYWLFAIFIFVFSNVYGQSCRNKLQEASKLFDDGLIDEIPSLLRPCMEDGFTRVEHIEAYKLMILAYLFDDNQVEAEKTMIEFLKRYPEYELMPNDAVEFEYLFNSYGTKSILSIDILVGGNICIPGFQKIYSTYDAGHTSYALVPGGGFQIGAGASLPVAKTLNLGVELFYTSNTYLLSTTSNLWMQSGSVEHSEVKIDESIHRFDIPLTLSYNFGSGNLSYFLRGGGQIGLNLSNKGVVSQVYAKNNQPITTGDYDFSQQRQSYNLFAIAGGGLRYKVSRGYIMLDLRYQAGLINQVKTPREDETLSTRYEFIHSDHKLNSVAISIGYEYSFYKSKKN